MGPILRETLRSLGARWGSVLLTGLYLFLLQSLLVIFTVVPVWLVGGAARRLSTGGSGGLPVAGVGLVGLLIPLLALVVLAPRIAAAIAFMAMQVRRGETVSLASLWAAGRRYWRPLFNYLGFLMVLGFVAAIIGLFVAHTPVPPVVWEIISMPFTVCFGGYGIYLIVAEGMLPADVVRTAWRILTRKTADVLWTSLILLLGGMALDSLDRLLLSAPLAGRIASVAVGLLGAPVAMLYLAHRYHANIGPTLTPPGGGAGTFDPRPFVGP